MVFGPTTHAISRNVGSLRGGRGDNATWYTPANVFSSATNLRFARSIADTIAKIS